MTRDGPIPTLYSAQILIDDSNRPSLTNFKYFTEGLASSIFLEAFTHLPPAEAVICLYCDKNVNKKDSINEILEKESISSEFTLMGHSMGGRIILGINEYFKDRIEAYIMLSPAGFQGAKSDSKLLFPKFIRKFLKLLTSQ
jgi:hypothetical protein